MSDLTGENFNNQYKIVVSGMLNEKEKLNIDDIIASLQSLDNNERARLQSALFHLQNDLDLKEAISEGLDDIKNGRVSSHEAVMKEIKESYS
ncbi:hypothetical protein [Mucilaginibacter gotjawali]|uniref:Transcriptional regulator n=1 Tax=Mucilaginibacter gotjawali TaxID=1550579 RepID=A0A839SEL5_9SPHI|nr:hypothetical protein [Mucilaginibacter gotjawali]MBB3056681.1 putative transcriptional regulator [Mucilaginibacter gotjawali]